MKINRIEPIAIACMEMHKTVAISYQSLMMLTLWGYPTRQISDSYQPA